MDENDVWLAGVFLDGVWAGTEGDTVWLPTGSGGDTYLETAYPASLDLSSLKLGL